MNTKPWWKLEMEEHRRRLRGQALALPPGDPPDPWSPGHYLHAGGVIAAGWDANENILLVSHDGYSLTDARTERRLLRNRDSDAGYNGLSQEGLSFTLPETGEVIPVFGIYGGDGIHVTADGWSLERIAPDWPDEMVLLREPKKEGSGARSGDYFNAAHRLTVPLGGTMRGCGFSPSGSQFMVVASDGAVAYARKPVLSDE